MGNLTENVDKESMKTGKNDKQRKNAGTCWDKKETATQQKITI